MKRLGMLVIVVAGFALTSAASASATVTWPAKCTTMSCVNDHLNSLKNITAAQAKTITTLNTRVATLTTRLNNLTGCLAEAPLTEYGSTNGSQGYWYSNDAVLADAFPTTAVDFTTTGDPVDAWVFVDECNTQTTAARPNAAQAYHSMFPEMSFGRPVARKAS